MLTSINMTSIFSERATYHSLNQTFQTIHSNNVYCNQGNGATAIPNSNSNKIITREASLLDLAFMLLLSTLPYHIPHIQPSTLYVKIVTT